MATQAIPGVMLDDVYRLLGDRDPAAMLLLVVAVEPEGDVVRVRYRLVDAAGEPLSDAAGAPLGIAGLLDAGSAHLRPGQRLRVPGRGEVGTVL